VASILSHVCALEFEVETERNGSSDTERLLEHMYNAREGTMASKSGTADSKKGTILEVKHAVR